MKTITEWAAVGTWKTGENTGAFWTNRKEALSDAQKMRRSKAIAEVRLLKRTITTDIYLTYRKDEK